MVVKPHNTDDKDNQLILKILEKYSSLDDLNKELEMLTGICHFFADIDEYEHILNYFKHPPFDPTLNTTKDLGDYQTPISLTDKICKYLSENGTSPQLVVEPTFGTGNFILSSLSCFKDIKHIHGVEIQRKYFSIFKISFLERFFNEYRITPPQINLQMDNIFTHLFPDFIKNELSKEILVIGNPPWVTNSELSALNSKNLPSKTNLKNHKGVDAITGKSNFDIAEYIMLRMIEEFSDHNGTIAFICKNIVSRNIIKFLPQKQYKLYDIKSLTIDAKKEFDVNCDASVFIAKMGKMPKSYFCEVADLDAPNLIKSKYGWVDNNFVSNIDLYESFKNLDGKCPFTWRQGIKHDASKVMELKIDGNQLQNSLGEIVVVDSDLIYPLIKSSDIKSFETTFVRKMVLVPQKRTGEDTKYIQEQYPKTWRYLLDHMYYFERRKSKIYQNKYPFSIFGVGEYSFKPYKVAISGMYKKSLFSVLTPINEKTVMLDDTCYFLSFDNYERALLICTLLNSNPTQKFIKSVAFSDSKRVYTKDLLMRINLKNVSEMTSLEDIKQIWRNMDFMPSIEVTEESYVKFKKWLLSV